MSETLRIVIADDERPARKFLRDLLAGFPEVEVAGEAATGREAVSVIEETRPDLALLDLQMPELDGLSVVRAIDRASLPQVAFVTAYDEYAVKAFELNAIDYLLKPVRRTRLKATVDRAFERRREKNWRRSEGARIQAAAATYDSFSPRYLERIPVRARDVITVLPVEQVSAIEAEGELLRITTHKKEVFRISYRLKDLEARLDPARFIRLSRGAIVNLRAVARFAAMPGGLYMAHLHNGHEVQVSRSQARELRDDLLRL